MIILWRDCDWCQSTEERLFTDSWTGLELCLSCLSIVDYITNSPASEGDNLEALLNEMAGERLI